MNRDEIRVGGYFRVNRRDAAPRPVVVNHQVVRAENLIILIQHRDNLPPKLRVCFAPISVSI